ncbi:MAG: hypothetical protein RL329_3707 [Bacteroidota bacterium]|jgi:hypothetical protein
MNLSPIFSFLSAKKSFLSLWLTFFVLFLFGTILGQTDEIATIASYVSKGDVTTSLIQKYGYIAPSYLETEWKQYPAVRKIEMAYQAAEHAQKDGGKNFLVLLSQDLAKQYEGARHELTLKPLLNESSLRNPISFRHPEINVNSNLADHIKHQILTISKYTEVGALGGTRGVLKHQFGLADTEVY